MLKTDYLDPEWEGDKVYVITHYVDGTVSFTDATTYINAGDYIESEDINTTNTAINTFANLYKNWIGGSFTPLKTNYVDSEWEGRKIYRETDNGDGTVGLTDVTTYDVVGTEYAANDINTTNTLLNSFTNGLDTGLASIAARLRALGVTDTSDLFAAIDAMTVVQRQNGIDQGKNDVLNNPNGYGLYTDTQYNTAGRSVNEKALKIRQAASLLAPCATNSTYMSGDIYPMNSATSRARSKANDIKSDMNSSTAQNVRGGCVEGAQLINSVSGLTDYSTSINNALAVLRS